jgi:probable RNA-binding protein EIF1AD
MSKATKRKHVTKESVENYLLPQHPQEIVKIISSRGNNLHEVETETGERYLVSMPTKFRRNVWVKRGGYVVVEPIVEGNKVKAEIVQILLKDQIKYIREEGKWPSAFADVVPQIDSDQSDHSGDDLPPNPNRPQVTYIESSDDTSSDDGESEEEEEEEEDGSKETD